MCVCTCIYIFTHISIYIYIYKHIHVYIHTYVHIYIYMKKTCLPTCLRNACPTIGSSRTQIRTLDGRITTCWPLQEILYFESFVHESNLFSILPPTCIVYTIAILLQDCCAVYNLPSTSPFYAIQHTILVITISCKGQITSSFSVGPTHTPVRSRSRRSSSLPSFVIVVNPPGAREARIFMYVYLPILSF